MKIRNRLRMSSNWLLTKVANGVGVGLTIDSARARASLMAES